MSANRLVQQGNTQETAPVGASTRVFGPKRLTLGGTNFVPDDSSDPVGAPGDLAGPVDIGATPSAGGRSHDDSHFKWKWYLTDG